ncbi:hypothetical protein AOQ84DRAFT_348153 [Glonium stellatum]|uniref:Diels-Alderase n=1 Tax=Glonium stellatum TaxID=574774 RepID=A0A8E2EQU1_9PEZI|nr:hypothetical protein AOQ84DRAFT_348153 [Glonium stellatum]
MVNGSAYIDTSPSTPFQWPTVPVLNSTAWEYWYFDGVSLDGTAGVTIVFFRDPSLATEGLGIMRVSLDAVWSNGTKFTTVMLANDSVVEQCGDRTTGTWTGPGMACSFEFTQNAAATIALAGVGITGEAVSGTYSLTSFSTARYPDGTSYPSRAASVELAPLIYWNEGVPGGNVRTDVVLAGSSLAFAGIGGTDRNWGPFTWDYVADHWWWLRAVAGPYTLVFWKFASPIDGKTHTYSYLEEHGVPVFTSTVEGAAAGGNGDYAAFELLYGGALHGSFADLSTGFQVGLHSPKRGKSWSFEVQHVHIVFEAPQGNDQYSRFVNTAKGGEVGCQVFTGVCKSEQNKIVQVPPMPQEE